MNKKRTEIAELGEFGLIDRLTANFKQHHATTIKGVGDDAAVLTIAEDEELVMTSDSFFEGVDFDLTYFPLKHLGYKVVTAVVSDLAAMNARPRQLMISIGVSSKIPVEALDDLYEGIRFACHEQQIDLEAVLGENLIEGLGLSRRAGEAVEDATFRILVFGHIVGNHLDYQRIGSELTTLDASLHLATQLRTLTDVTTNHLARRDVLDAEVFLKQCCLGTLTTTRRTK